MTIDLRSDTVAMPSPEMRQAMVEAPLGDDVFGDDPTTNRLLEVAAERMGKAAATFVPSGTMGNLIGVAVNAQRGQELIADADSHVFYYETAGAAAVCGVQIRPLATESGVMSPEQIVAAVRPRDDPHEPISAAVTFEDTHNRHGGIAWPLGSLRAASKAAHQQGLRVHLDGARIFNAAVALGAEASDIAACADTVTFCLSKGLACPIGSIFCGSEEDVEEAKRWRTLAEGLSEIRGVTCDLSRVQTNLVYFDLDTMPAAEFTDQCTERGLLSAPTAARTMRFVTHYGITAEDVQSALQICDEVLSA